MPKLYGIIILIIVILSVPLLISLVKVFETENLFFMIVLLVGPLLTMFGLFVKHLNRKIFQRYIEISKVTGGKVSKTRVFSKPSLEFPINENQCYLTCEMGSKCTPNITILQTKVNLKVFLRLFRNDLFLKGLKKLNLDWPDVEIGDREFDEFFIVETKNAEFAKKLFSGEALSKLKNIMKNIYEVRLEDGLLRFSFNEIYPSIDNYKYIIESFEACLNNIATYSKA